MDEYASESDSDYTSYWRDWVSRLLLPAPVYWLSMPSLSVRFAATKHNVAPPVSVPTAFCRSMAGKKSEMRL